VGNTMNAVLYSQMGEFRDLYHVTGDVLGRHGEFV
jgi:hypothetical protein